MVTRFLTRVWLKNAQNRCLIFLVCSKITKTIGFFLLYKCLQISFLLILNSYTKFELNSLRNNEITMKLLITDILAVATKRKSEMTSYLNNAYDVMNYFAKFENSYLIG